LASPSQIKIYNRDARRSFSGVSIYRLDGSQLVDHAALDTFAVISEWGEMVMLDFGTIAGETFFTHAGVVSTEVEGAAAPVAINT